MSRHTFTEGNGARTHFAMTASTGSAQQVQSGALLRPAVDSRVLAIEIFNNGSNPVFVSQSSSGVTTAGRPIAAGSSWTDTASDGPWYIQSTGGTSDVRVTVVIERWPRSPSLPA